MLMPPPPNLSDFTVLSAKEGFLPGAAGFLCGQDAVVRDGVLCRTGQGLEGI